MRLISYSRYKMSDLQKIATDNNLKVLIKISKVRKGWLGQTKGILQVLWKRG